MAGYIPKIVQTSPQWYFLNLYEVCRQIGNTYQGVCLLLDHTDITTLGEFLLAS